MFDLLELGGRYGVQPAAFWDMTPREFWAYIAGCRKAERLRHRLEMQTAWFGAMWARVEKLPPLERAIRGLGEDDAAKAKPQKMTPAESRLRVRMAFARWGVHEKKEA